MKHHPSFLNRSLLQRGETYRPTLPKLFDANQPPTIRLFPLSNYTFGTKEQQPEEDPSVLARLKRLEEHYEEHGMRRTCEGVLVCHEHNHPHILMLQIANAFFKLCVTPSSYPTFLTIARELMRVNVPDQATTSRPMMRRSKASNRVSTSA